MRGRCRGMQLPCAVLHFLHLFFSPPILLSPYANSLVYIFLFPAARAHVHIFTPYLVLFVKAEFVPVGWKSNEGKSRCYCAAVDCAPPTPSLLFPTTPATTAAATPPVFIDCEPQTRQMLGLYASSVSCIHLPSRNS